MRPSVPALPRALHAALAPFRFLFHADTWPVFLCVLTGLLTGHTTLACVRASLLTAAVRWHQCCDFYRRARWSRAASLRAKSQIPRFKSAAIRLERGDVFSGIWCLRFGV